MFLFESLLREQSGVSSDQDVCLWKSFVGLAFPVKFRTNEVFIHLSWSGGVAVSSSSTVGRSGL